MMMLDQVVSFFVEWGWLMALLLFIGGLMAADFFPRVYAFMAHIESKYPQFETYLFTKEQELIGKYDQLPSRIKSGFALIGGKVAWAWLVTRMYRYLRERT
ncbi:MULTISPECIES: hypothetical protein [Brevibacillus]|nr:hypothetical protein [Brevibacillus porteri]MED1800280.1 hypothetical protein [Brevibacillus porteri]MED2130788.1 hypothetical protein [Brevibacillus porteri]MED2744951.1 hypothetical protein [Brevibacillus porteri]MED2813401.1 hypothetical protein [Brevibacillus porteri]MED2894998.1 hypothetical protein [Brevibacillus porteri]